MAGTLQVEPDELRTSAQGIGSVAAEVTGVGTTIGSTLSDTAASSSPLLSATACGDVGARLGQQVKMLGEDLSRHADKLYAAATAYEKTDGEAARKIRPPSPAGGGDNPGGTSPTDPYEKALRDAGLLSGPLPDGYYRKWLQNAARRGVPVQTIVDIARQQHISADSFKVLDPMEEIVDPDGKSFFLLPKGTSAADARRAVLMTYILNAGTDYDAAGRKPGVTNSFKETPYSAAEVQRIADRQNANGWSYDKIGFLEDHGGRMVTTPNGMLMADGGGTVQNVLSQQGGSTYGDIFMVNIDHPADAAQQLRDIVGSGNSWQAENNGSGAPFNTGLDLDRVLHHEERHSEQWAREGFAGFIADYGWQLFRERVLGKTNELEKDAGLADGGYT